MTDAQQAEPAREGGLPPLHSEKHVQFIKKSAEENDTMEFVLTEYLRMSGVYWGITCLELLGQLDAMDSAPIIEWLLRCQDKESGGFGGSEGHDAHLLYTLSAVQILALYDKLSLLDADRVAAFVASLQQPDGSFAGDQWGELDTRFSYCALSCCSLLGRLDKIDVDGAARFVASCRNFDGGFGATPGGESHAGQVFTAVGALAIAGALHEVDADLLGWWLAERQVKGGGLNGRPEKLPDVCYSWRASFPPAWVLSALSILGRLHWIDTEALGAFILNCQDAEKGGISDRPDDEADVFHTFFGVAGLSLMGFEGLKAVDPVYALPVHVVERMKLRGALTVKPAVATS